MCGFEQRRRFGPVTCVRDIGATIPHNIANRLAAPKTRCFEQRGKKEGWLYHSDVSFHLSCLVSHEFHDTSIGIHERKTGFWTCTPQKSSSKHRPVMIFTEIKLQSNQECRKQCFCAYAYIRNSYLQVPYLIACGLIERTDTTEFMSYWILLWLPTSWGHLFLIPKHLAYTQHLWNLTAEKWDLWGTSTVMSSWILTLFLSGVAMTLARTGFLLESHL